MAEGLIVGIFSESDPQKLESALSAQQVDLSKVKVVSTNTPDPEDESTQLEFVDVIADMESNSLADDMTRGMGVLDDSSGTGVPGISSGGHQMALDPFAHHAAASRGYLAGFPIPSDEVDNFCDAIADGRAVVLYTGADSDGDAIVTAFKAAGLKNVRAY